MTLERFQILLLHLKQILNGKNIRLFADESKVTVRIPYCSTARLSEILATEISIISHIERFQQTSGQYNNCSCQWKHFFQTHKKIGF